MGGGIHGGRLNAGAFRGLLFVLLGVQVAVGGAEIASFFSGMVAFQSRFAGGWPTGGGSSLVLVAGVLAVAVLWTKTSFSGGTFAAAGLANIAALGLVHYGVALFTGRLVPAVSAGVLLASALLAVALRDRHSTPRVSLPALTIWDGLSALFLLMLLVPTVFPYIHFDAKEIWAARAYAMDERGFSAAVTGGSHQSYPPLFSILLWLGIRDPLFQGRLLPVVVAALFALFLRSRLSRVFPRGAPAATLFFVCTVHVWRGTAMYYADTALMTFLSAGVLLVLGLPRGVGRPDPTKSELAAGTLCLSAAVLVRPDGLYYLGVVAVAAVWVRLWKRCPVSPWPVLVAAGAFATWVFRPVAQRGPVGFFFRETDGWRSMGTTAVSAALATLASFLDSIQGQWLSHKGLGAAVYAAALAAFWLRARRREDDAGREDARFFGVVTLGSFAAVALCYIAIPFIGDVVAAVQPHESGDWGLCYQNFVRVGAGRMTVHLYPFLVLYLLAAAATISSSRTST